MLREFAPGERGEPAEPPPLSSDVREVRGVKTRVRRRGVGFKNRNKTLDLRKRLSFLEAPSGAVSAAVLEPVCACVRTHENVHVGHVQFFGFIFHYSRRTILCQFQVGRVVIGHL